jgi:hypothetical protein
MRTRGGSGILFLLALTVAVSVLAAGTARARSDLDAPTAFGQVPEHLYAIREPNIFTHNVGLLTLQVTNVGILGNPFIQDFSAGWQGGEYLFFAGIWVGAIGSDSEPHVSTAVPFELRPDLSPVYTIYESFEGVKNGFRLGGADPAAADDDSDGLVDEDFHNGLDDDGDGRIDEDFAAIGQQMFSCEYRDDTPEAIGQVTDHTPLNIRVLQRSFQWSTTDINEMVGFEYELINTGEQRLKDVYIGFFSDTDAGPKTAERYWTDDLVGWRHIDTTITDEFGSGACTVFDLEIDTAFMWDAPDNGTTITGGDVPGVFGSLFLGHTTDDTGARAPQQVGLTTVAWFSSSGANSDPQNDDERYALLSSGDKPNRNANKPDDYRYVIAAGPFSRLNPGESLTFQTAYVIGNGQAGFRRNAVSAQRVFNGQYIDADQNEMTGIDGKERCLRALEPGDEVIWNDPCDTLEVEDPPHRSSECKWVDGDCNPCTGVGGAEQLINWVGTTAPPPPSLNTDPTIDPFVIPGLEAFVPPAGDKKVVLQWDNASELRVDPITGAKLFEGYRVWRVDNWQRPEGSIGPAPEEWMLIAEFRLNPKDPLGFNSPNHLSQVTDRDVNFVDETDSGDPIYPIGRYSYTDSLGIINGKVHFYSVTAFGILKLNDPVTGEEVEIELGGQPAASEVEVVIPRWAAQEGGVNCDAIRVVPNPYRGSAAWDLIPSEQDPTGTKIAFRNLPNEKSTVRIYTLSGDLVQSAEHDGRNGDGTYFWNLITRNGQNVVSGMYLYSVEHPGGVCRGRFVIIR